MICLSSTLISTFGLEPIISIAAPILDVIYPPVLVLILLSFFQKYILTVWVYRLAALGTLMISLLTAAGSVFPLSQRLLSQLPLSGLGLGWIVPAVICALAGCLLHRRSPDQRHSPA